MWHYGNKFPQNVNVCVPVSLHLLKEACVHQLVEYFEATVAWRCGDKRKLN